MQVLKHKISYLEESNVKLRQELLECHKSSQILEECMMDAHVCWLCLFLNYKMKLGCWKFITFSLHLNWTWEFLCWLKAAMNMYFILQTTLPFVCWRSFCRIIYLKKYIGLFLCYLCLLFYIFNYLWISCLLSLSVFKILLILKDKLCLKLEQSCNGNTWK